MPKNHIGVSTATVFAVILVACIAFPSKLFDNKTAQVVAAVVMFVVYCLVVGVFAVGKKREISLLWQTVIGAIVALTIAAVFRVPSEGYALAVVLGLGLGATAHKWVEHVQLP